MTRGIKHVVASLSDADLIRGARRVLVTASPDAKDNGFYTKRRGHWKLGR